MSRGAVNRRLNMINIKNRIIGSLMIVFLMMTIVTGTAFLESGTSYAASGYAAPVLKKLQYYQSADGSYNAMIYWKAKKGATYQILRMKSGESKWKVVGTKKATSASASFKNKKIGKATYKYTVRRVLKKGKKIKKRGKYDSEGLTTLAMPSVNVSFTNLNAVITWTKVDGAQKYLVYRKFGKSGTNQLIASLSADRTSYKDIYYKSAKNKDMAKLLTSDYLVDPSDNNISYTVRPYYSKKAAGTTKESYGLYLRDGEFHLEPPTLVSMTPKGAVKWGTVPNADGYLIITRKSANDSWSVVNSVKAEKKPGKYQSYTIKSVNTSAYYAVRAYTMKNGKKVYSKFDPSFTLKNSGAGSGKNVLFLGDSMTFGSPYYGVERENFSYAHRIKQLTGIRMFNPSIPGSTWRYHPLDNRYRIVNGVAGMIARGENTDYAFETLQIGTNKQKFEDFDIVLLGAGTNDYQDKTETPFGSRERDWEKITDKTTGLSFTVNAGTKYAKTYKNMNYDYNIGTFDGAYNQILKYIEEASVIRVMQGKPPIKVIQLSLFYSDRTYPYYEIHNRNVTKNHLGYTMLDYQAEMDAIVRDWANSPVLEFYRYDTQAANIVNSSNCGYMASDNLHYTKYAYSLFGDSIASFMLNNKLFNAKSDAQIKAIKESEEFRALLKKYSRSSSFVSKLSSQLIADMNDILKAAETETEEAVEPEEIIEEPAPAEEDEITSEPQTDEPEAPAEPGTSTETETQTEESGEGTAPADEGQQAPAEETGGTVDQPVTGSPGE